MEWIDILSGFVLGHDSIVLLALTALVLFLVISNLCLLRRVGKISRQSKPDKAQPKEASLADEGLVRRIEKSEEQLAQLTRRQYEVETALANSVQRIALKRFDAFPDVGGEQSFALAILDRDMNGVVVSNLYSRSDSRVYAKEITKGRSQQPLSDEEQEAVRLVGDSQG